MARTRRKLGFQKIRLASRRCIAIDLRPFSTSTVLSMIIYDGWSFRDAVMPGSSHDSHFVAVTRMNRRRMQEKWVRTSGVWNRLLKNFTKFIMPVSPYTRYMFADI